MTALIWCPFPDEDTAARVTIALLDEKLVACANLLGAMRSLYRWNGESGDTRESGALFKTDGALLDRAVARLAELHPYEAPAIVGWRCDAAADATANWLKSLAS